MIPHSDRGPPPVARGPGLPGRDRCPTEAPAPPHDDPAGDRRSPSQAEDRSAAPTCLTSAGTSALDGPAGIRLGPGGSKGVVGWTGCILPMCGPTSQLILTDMSEITRLTVDAHIQDLRRNAAGASCAAAAAARQKTKPGLELPVTIRRATESDEAALARLAALDSAAVPAAPVLLAESNGELRAALSLRDGETVADPFHPTAKLLELLATFAAQGQDGRRSLMGGRRWRRLRRRRALSGRAVLGHSSWPSRLRRA